MRPCRVGAVMTLSSSTIAMRRPMLLEVNWPNWPANLALHLEQHDGPAQRRAAHAVKVRLGVLQNFARKGGRALSRPG